VKGFLSRATSVQSGLSKKSIFGVPKSTLNSIVLASKVDKKSILEAKKSNQDKKVALVANLTSLKFMKAILLPTFFGP